MRLSFWAIGIVAVLVIVLLLSGCSSFTKRCTQIGCGDQLTIEIPGLVLPKHFIVQVNDFKYDNCLDNYQEDSSTGYKQFEGEKEFSVYAGNMKYIGEDKTQITLVPSRDKSGELITNVKVLIQSRQDCSSIDTKPILEKSFIAEYKIFQPNGPECEPTCYQAFTSITDY